MAASEIKTVKTNTMEMDYFTFGEGKKTFIMLPGASLKSVMLSKDAVASAYSMFADAYTVYVFDLRKDLKDGYAIEAMASDTANAMSSLGISDAYVFGCSLGGMIAQSLAEDYPWLVKKLILASTMARANSKSRQTCDTWLALCEKKDVVGINREFARSVYSEEFYSQYEDIFKSMENDGTDEEMDRLHAQVSAFKDFDGFKGLEKIKCPVLVMGAWEDKVLSYEGSIELAEALHSDCYMYSGHGHAVYDEAPDFKNKIKAFFAD